MIYVVNKKRKAIIRLINMLGLIAYPVYFFIRKKWGKKKKLILAELGARSINTIAINCIDRLGDTLFLLPAIKAVKKSYPDAWLIVITNGLGGEIFRNNPYVDEIIYSNNNWIGKSLVSPLELLRSLTGEYLDAIKKIRKRKIDLLVEVKGDFRNIIFFDIWLGARYSTGYALSGFGWMLDWEIPYRTGIHEIDAKLNIAEALGADISDREIDFYLSRTDEDFAENFYKSQGILEADKTYVFHIGGTWEPRLWPLDNFIAIGRRLIEEQGAKLILVGDKREKDKIDKFIAAVPEAIRLENARISEVAAVIKKADLFLGNDSGPSHLARSVKTPLVVIHGPEKLDRVGPENYGIALRHEFPCSPCGQVKCDKSPNCVESITVDEVWEAINRL